MNPFKAVREEYAKTKANAQPITEVQVARGLEKTGSVISQRLTLGNILNATLIISTIAVSAYGMNLNTADQVVLAEQKEQIAALDAQNNRLSNTYTAMSSADNSKATLEAIRTKAQSIADVQMRYITTTDLSVLGALKDETHDLFVDSAYQLGSTITPDGPYFLSGIGETPALHIDTSHPVYETNGTWSVILTLRDEAGDVYGWATLTYSPVDQRFTRVESQLTGYGQKIIDDIHAKVLEEGFGSHYEGLDGVATEASPSAEPSSSAEVDPNETSSNTASESPSEEASANNEGDGA